ncbi:MAG: MBL fold metallo-hydrolase [Verrucomicrobia bacterium]|nr:MBL fold metallo-hydrolase [Verrucomicrobiota bacterium]
MSQIAIRIIYDNRKDNPAMQEGWGFSCLIEIAQRKILFDTGADAKAFFSNLKQAGIDLADVTDICFSHKHADHVAGLEEVLSRMNKETRLFVPKGFPKRNFPVQVTYVSDFAEIDSQVYSLVLKGGLFLYEQALVLRSNKGLVVITGCAHPGIVHILETVKARFGEAIHLVLGGFHLFRKDHKSINKIVDQFKSLQVEKAAPCHCSGDLCIAEFQNAYQDGFYKIGTGTAITLDC